MAVNWIASNERNLALLQGKLDMESRREMFFSDVAFTMSGDMGNAFSQQKAPIALPKNKILVKIPSPFNANSGQFKNGGNKYVIRTLNRISGSKPGQAGGVVLNQDRARGKEGVDTYREHEIVVGRVRKPWTAQTDEFSLLLQGNWGKITRDSLPGRMNDFHNRYESFYTILMAAIWGQSLHAYAATSQGGLGETKRLHKNVVFAGQANPTWSATAATWEATCAQLAMTMRNAGVAGQADTHFGKAFMDRLIYEADNIGIPMIETPMGMRRICLIHPDQRYEAANDPELASILKGFVSPKADRSEFYINRMWLDYGECIWVPDFFGGLEATPYLNTQSDAGLNDTNVTAANATNIAFGPLSTSTEADPYDGTKYRPVELDPTDYDNVRSTSGATGYATGIRVCLMLGDNALIGVENGGIKFADMADDYDDIQGICTRTTNGVARNDDWQPSVATKTTCRNTTSLLGFSQTKAQGEILATA